VGAVFWLVIMSMFAVTSRYWVLCVTWIMCEHCTGRRTDMGVVEKRRNLRSVTIPDWFVDRREVPECSSIILTPGVPEHEIRHT
jgi:hypothetical protein